MSYAVVEIRDWVCDLPGCSVTVRTEAYADGRYPTPPGWVITALKGEWSHYCSESHARDHAAAWVHVRHDDTPAVKVIG